MLQAVADCDAFTCASDCHLLIDCGCFTGQVISMLQAVR